MPHNLVFVAFSMVLPKRKYIRPRLYDSVNAPVVIFNSLLALLNSRDTMRKTMADVQPLSVHLSKIAIAVTDYPHEASDLNSRHAHEG